MIGLTLGVTGGDAFVTLLAALAFHQFFEVRSGKGGGGCSAYRQRYSTASSPSTSFSMWMGGWVGGWVGGWGGAMGGGVGQWGVVTLHRTASCVRPCCFCQGGRAGRAGGQGA